MSERIPITKKGMMRIKEELHELMTVSRPQVQKEIATAREHGDLRENAEYHAAKEKQSFIEGRIQEINGKMPLFQVVDPSQHSGERVVFGASVTLENVDSGEVMEYQIVGPDEADLKANRISFQTPIGRALIGKTLGDVVEIQVPRGRLEVEITDVSFG